MRRRIQVANLSHSVDDGALAALFSPHGDVNWAAVSTDFETGQRTGMGFVEMDCEQAGDAAIAALSGSEHLGRKLSVCWNTPPGETTSHQRPGPAAGAFGDRGGRDSAGE